MICVHLDRNLSSNVHSCVSHDPWLKIPSIQNFQDIKDNFNLTNPDASHRFSFRKAHCKCLQIFGSFFSFKIIYRLCVCTDGQKCRSTKACTVKICLFWIGSTTCLEPVGTETRLTHWLNLSNNKKKEKYGHIDAIHAITDLWGSTFILNFTVHFLQVSGSNGKANESIYLPLPSVINHQRSNT